MASLWDRLFSHPAPMGDPGPLSLPGPTALEPVRNDTTSSGGAALSNALSGLGGTRDSGASARPNPSRELLSQEELILLLRGGVYRRIVELLPKWCTVRGWTLTDDTDDPRPLYARMRDLRVRSVVREADIWGRALGESRILLVTDDPAPLHEPLDISRVRALHRLEVLDRREFSPVRFRTSMRDGELGEPELYQLHPRRSGGSASPTVHASRLLRFHGHALPPSERSITYDGWGSDAIGQVLWDGIRNLSQTGTAGAKAAQELSVAVFKLQRLQSTVAGDQGQDALSRLGLIGMMKSIANSVLLTPNDSYERVNINAAGFKDLSDHARHELALLADAPMTLLFGEAPGGLNTDGTSWQASWHASVASHHEERYRDPLETIIRILYQVERGGEPDTWSLQFEPLGQLTETEKAAIRETVSRTDGQAILDGIITPDEARSRYIGGGFAYELQALPERVAPVRPVVDPQVEASAAAMVEQALARKADARRTQDADNDFRAKSYTVPAGARGNARKVLAWKQEHGEAVAGMTETGWRRARQLATSDTVTGQDLIEIAAWFARHGANESTRTVSSEYEGEPWRDAGYVSWLGWGGDTMRALARATVARNRTDATEGAVWIGCTLPESAREAFAAARLAVEGITGPLDVPDDDPHVTVLYLGQVDPALLTEVVEIVRQVTERMQPEPAGAERAVTFAPGAHSEGKWPVVLDVGRAWGLVDLHARLLPRLAHLITARQHPTYRPHLTLGYAADLTPEHLVKLAEVELEPAAWTVGGVEVRVGSTRLAVLPFAGRVDAAASRAA